MNTNLKSKLYMLLGNGKIEELIDLLLLYYDKDREGEGYQEVLPLKSRYSTVEKDRRAMLITLEEYYLERNKIASSLQFCIRNISDNHIVITENNIMAWDRWYAQVEYLKEILGKVYVDFVPDVMIGITNGGLLVLDILARDAYKSHELHIPTVSLWANRQEREELFNNPYNDALLLAINTIHKTTHKEDKSKIKILLIDDLVKMSVTYFQAKYYLNKIFGSAMELLFLPLFVANNDYLVNNPENNAKNELIFGFRGGKYFTGGEPAFNEKFKVKENEKWLPWGDKELF